MAKAAKKTAAKKKTKLKVVSKKKLSAKKGGITSIVVKYDAGFPNQLTIRGCGAGLTWNEGKQLKNISSDEWVWETQENFEDCEFKVLLNDQEYELGENHHLLPGQQFFFTPKF